MKTLLIVDKNIGQASAQIAREMLAAAAVKAGHQIVTSPLKLKLFWPWAIPCLRMPG